MASATDLLRTAGWQALIDEGCPTTQQPSNSSSSPSPRASAPGDSCAAWPPELDTLGEANSQLPKLMPKLPPSLQLPKLPPSLDATLRDLAASWLEPLRLRAAALARNGSTASWATEADKAALRQRCPLIIVRDGEVFLKVAVDDPMLGKVSLRRCGRVGGSAEPAAHNALGRPLLDRRGRAFNVASPAPLGWQDGMNVRLLTTLRLLRLALRSPPPAGAPAWPDAFSFRVCLDDECHDTSASGSALPVLSMVACGGPGRAITLPTVQWMATNAKAETEARTQTQTQTQTRGGRDGARLGSHASKHARTSEATRLAVRAWGARDVARDVDLAVWPQELARRRAAREAADARWGCRQQVAVWRGTVHIQHGVSNAEWTSNRTVHSRCRGGVEPITNASWRTQARFALLHQRCLHPRLLNVRAQVARNGRELSTRLWREAGLLRMPEYAACEAEATATDEPRHVSMDDQARLFQMTINVEGSSGWADRLRHLLLSGMVVLKQDSGITEWWEPLLVPFVHYVPVSSTLHNLSDAVRWVRAHQAQARAIARDAAALVEAVLSPHALAAYFAHLLRGYAALDAASRPAQPSARPWTTARFSCGEVVQAATVDGRTRGGRRTVGAHLPCRFSSIGKKRASSPQLRMLLFNPKVASRNEREAVGRSIGRAQR